MTALEPTPESRQRAEAYWFLASLFADPPEVEQLRRMAQLAAQAGGQEDGGLAAQILAAIEGEADFEQLAQRQAVEHTRLFGGLREGYGPPPPYESLWREGRMMGQGTIAVLTAFAEAGFEPEGRWGPCDHIVEELRFVAALANGETEAWGTARADDARWARERQSDFLAQHLLGWLPNYCRALEAHAKEPLYQALARVAADALAEDARALGVA